MDIMHTPFPFGWHIPFFLYVYRIKIKCTIIINCDIHDKSLYYSLAILMQSSVRIQYT